MPTPSPPAEPISLAPPMTYPELEELVERVSTEEVSQLFARLKESLVALKGPRTEQAKKAKVALERTEELLGRLLDLRESLTQLQKKPVKKPR